MSRPMAVGAAVLSLLSAAATAGAGTVASSPVAGWRIEARAASPQRSTREAPGSAAGQSSERAAPPPRAQAPTVAPADPAYDYLRDATTESSQSRDAKSVKALTRRPDEKRPPDQYTVQWLGRPLTIGGEYSLRSRYRDNFDLGTDPSDRWRVDQEAQLELFYPARDTVFFFVEGKLRRTDELYIEGDDRESETGLSRGETWAYFAKLFETGFDLQIGRQNIRETREWWWDADLDAVRAHFLSPSLRAELALAEELDGVSTNPAFEPPYADVTRWLGRVVWPWRDRQRIELFFLAHDDHSGQEPVGAVIDEADDDELDGDLIWAGVRATGRVKAKPWGRFYYWLDTAAVRGDEAVSTFEDVGDDRIRVTDIEEREVRGWAVDLGVTWLPSREWGWAFNFGYAFGSGDRNPDDGVDRAFRQTGLQDNNQRLRGVNRFRYYGELLRPELSNLHIVTLAVGHRWRGQSSIEVLYHRYWQDHAADSLRDGRLRIQPLGADPAIGQELDVVLGFEEDKHWELELIFAAFRAGDAYGPASGEWAYHVRLQADYNF